MDDAIDIVSHLACDNIGEFGVGAYSDYNSDIVFAGNGVNFGDTINFDDALQFWHAPHSPG